MAENENMELAGQGNGTGEGSYTSQEYGAGSYTSQDYGAGSYTPQENGAGTYASQAYGAGTYTSQENGAGSYASQDYGAGSYTSQDSGAGSYAPQESGTGTYALQESAAGNYTPQESVGGIYTPQESAAGSDTPQESGAESDTPQESEAEDASGKKKGKKGKKEKKEPKAKKVKEQKPKKAPPKKSIVGVEIGNSRVKIVETRKGRLNRFAAEDIPDDVVRDGGVLQWEAMADLLKEALKKNKISGKKAALVVPDSIAFTRRTLMPPMSAVQLEYNLPYEFHDFITEDKDKYVYDYSMVDLVRDEEGNVTDMDLLAVAAPKEVLSNYIRMFKRAGLKLITAAPESQALGNICRELRPEMAGIDYALLDLGSSATRIDIFSKGIYEVTRTIDTGANAIVSVIADIYGCDPHIAEMYMRENKDNILANEACRDIYSRIAIDVMRAINYYTFENRENTLETMYYYGGSSVNEPLIEEIRDTIQLEFLPLSALSEGDEALKSAIMHGASALGICWE